MLNKITQSHLALLFLDKESRNPIARMPVYAEISITETALPKVFVDLKIDAQDKVPSLLNLRFSLFMNGITYAELSKKRKDELRQYLQTLISDSIDKISNSTESEKENIIDAVIEETLTKLKLPIARQPLKRTISSYPLGYLATDHVGYASYDLSNFTRGNIFKSSDSEADIQQEYAFYVYPMGVERTKFNALEQSRLTKDVVFAKFEVPADMRVLKELKPANLHSMQNPSLIDWYLSPSSFSVNPSYFIGQDGCENLFPANFATQEFRFFQIIRGKTIQEEVKETITNPDVSVGFFGIRRGSTPPTGVKSPKILAGSTLEYLTTWQPLGHTLGSIIYSLPLAPGEIVKIAIIDWERKSKDSRDEDLTVKEQLVHNTKRDRTISETVEAALHEWQRGGSIMGGSSGGAGLSASYGPVGIAAGNAHSFGGAYSTSSGDRNFTVSTVQQASDAFAQHSASFRELRSTIVVQSDQKEYAKAETRVVANHNHSHALTMLYYEVLRHFKVTTEFVRVRSSLMVDYSALIVDFNENDEIINHRLVLEQALLDSRLQECFASFDKLICATAEFNNAKEVWTKEKERIEKLPNPKDNIFHRYEIKILTGDDGTDGDPYVDLFSSDGQTIHLHQTSPTPEKDDTTILGTNNTGDFEKGETNIFLCNGSMPISWEKLKKIRLGLKDDSTSDVEDSTWNVKRVTLKGYTSESQESILFDSEVNATMEDEPDKYAEWAILLPPANPSIPPEPVIDSFIKDDLCCINKLQKHIVSNSQHYNRAIWLLEDPNDRASRFDGVTVNGKSLLDWIENRPLDVLGNYVVFPADPAIGGLIEEPEKVKVEKLITLPTRGVFGEAKLGHCNASEIIDNTRFWDWQTSPIPEQTSEISPVSTDSRNVTQNLSPTALPNSIVNIVNPSNLPDPTAMASALNLLGKSDIFRNMSMSKEVNDLLKQLSSDAVKYGELALKARQVLDKQNTDSNSSANPSGSPSGQPNGDSQTSSKEPNLSPQQFMDWMNATKNSPLSEKDKKDVMQDIKQGAKATVNPQQPKVGNKTEIGIDIVIRNTYGRILEYGRDTGLLNFQYFITGDVMTNGVLFGSGPNLGAILKDLNLATPKKIQFELRIEESGILVFNGISSIDLNKDTGRVRIDAKMASTSVSLTFTKAKAFSETIADGFTSIIGSKISSTTKVSLAGQIDETVQAEINAQLSRTTTTTTGETTTTTGSVNYAVLIPIGNLDLVVK